MERADRIRRHPKWREYMEQIRALERDRVFCGHGAAHCLDVARLAYIEDLERNLNIPVELIYAAALLHDIGRPLEYQRGIPHHQASAAAAEPILRDCGFSGEEQETILAAVLRHRTEGTALEDNLAGLLYRADKASRDCLLCPAADACRWSPEKKNLTLKR